MNIIYYILIFLIGSIIGSLLNIVIYNILNRKHIKGIKPCCAKCSNKLEWYMLVPIAGYMFSGGKCRKCSEKISIQYPLVEGLNGLLYVLVFGVFNFSVEMMIFCVLSSALIVLTIIDFKTYEIPIGINYCIFGLGIIRVIFDYKNWISYVIGFFAVSILLYLIYRVSKGTAIGGGDVKLMAAAGTVIGWKLIILAFFTGCILGSVIHIIRMKISHENHMLAMGPYLALGIFISMLYGNQIIEWYLGTLL